LINNISDLSKKDKKSSQKMSQTISPEPGQTGWVKFEEVGSGSPTKRKSPTSSGVSSARGSVKSLADGAEAAAVNGQVILEQPGALAVSEIQVKINSQCSE
jgi:hypothetical protein